MTKKIHLTSVVLLTLLLCGPHSLRAQDTKSLRELYVKNEYMIPMRDGKKLYTQVYSPKDQSERYPFLMTRTPYSVGFYGAEAFRPSLGPSREFEEEKYIFVYQDVRGKFLSEGKFFHHPPFIVNKKGPQDVDESSDAYDTIDWLIKNHPNHNGKVGIWGISAAGYTAAKAMIEAHPALAAASPQAAPGEQFIGDDYHHYGAFRLMYAFSWTSSNARIRSGPTEERPPRFDYGTPDGYQFFLDLGPISNVNKLYFKGQVPTWTEFVDHPNYDKYWQGKNVMKDMKNIRFPVLNVIGWFDAEDYYGPWGIYRAIETMNPQNQNHVVVGPWSHGGWARSGGESLGYAQFGSKTSEYFRQEIQLPFFNAYLKGKGSASLPKVKVFETGKNQWHSFDTWPPKNTKEQDIYLGDNGTLSFTPPAGEGSDSFVSDPDHPVPYTSEIRTSQGSLWIVEDQRFASRRPDVLVYKSPPLKEDVTIAGPIIAVLHVSTTGTDADWVVKLIDVFPGDAPDPEPNPENVRMGGYQLQLAAEVFRSKYRKSFSQPEPLKPGEVTKIEFNLLDKFHTFLKGHRIMIQIQSTWFPLIDRNPQNFVNIFEAKEEDFQKATHTVYRSRQFPTHLRLQVMTR